jgi:hypothetical protein
MIPYHTKIAVARIIGQTFLPKDVDGKVRFNEPE